jgi:type IV secretion system protein TrbL
MMRSKGHQRAVAAFGMFVLTAGPGAAQVATIGGGIDNIVSAFEGAVNAASGNLLTAAKTLLGSLLLIELILTIGKIVVKGSDLGEIFAALAQRILIAGFYLFLMDSLPGLGGMNGLVGASAEALAGLGSGGQAIKPSDILGQSLATASSIYGASSGIAETIAAAIIGIVIVILTAITIAMIVVAYVEIHVVFGLGIVALGFGGFSGTDGIARGYLMAGIAKTLKLFAMLVLSSIFGAVFQTLGFGLLASDGAGDFMTQSFTLVAAAAVMMMVVLTVPPALEQAVAGANAGGASASGGAGSAIRGAAKGAGGKAVGMAGGAAGKLGGLAAKGAGAAGSAAWNASGGAKAASAMKARVSAALGRNS